MVLKMDSQSVGTMWAAATIVVMALNCPAQADEKPLTLEGAITLAMSTNKTLAAARLGREVAQARVDIAGQRPNPEFAFEAERETPHQAYTLSQPIETARKRKRRVELSEAAADSYEAEIASLTAETRFLTRQAYYTLSAAQFRVSELQQIADLAERAFNATKERFELGDVPQLEALQTELNFAQARNDLSAAVADLGAARIGLNTLLAMSPEHPTTASESLDVGAVPEATVALDLATSASVELALLDHRILEEQARLNLAHAQRFPDVVLQGAITTNAEPEFHNGWRAGISFDLPLLNQYRGEIKLEESTLAQLQAEREASMAQIRGLVSAALMVASAKREKCLRYRDQILVQAVKVEQMATESYTSGQTGLVTMLQALGAARDIRLKSVESGLEYQIALAELEHAIGAPLP